MLSAGAGLLLEGFGEVHVRGGLDGLFDIAGSGNELFEHCRIFLRVDRKLDRLLLESRKKHGVAEFKTADAFLGGSDQLVALQNGIAEVFDDVAVLVRAVRVDRNVDEPLVRRVEGFRAFLAEL